MLHNTETGSQVNIEFHADDFALFPAQSQRILDCHTHGRLNGTSIFPNSPYLDECMALLHPYEDELALTVHLNLIEGQSVCPRFLFRSEGNCHVHSWRRNVLCRCEDNDPPDRDRPSQR